MYRKFIAVLRLRWSSFVRDLCIATLGGVVASFLSLNYVAENEKSQAACLFIRDVQTLSTRLDALNGIPLLRTSFYSDMAALPYASQMGKALPAIILRDLLELEKLNSHLRTITIEFSNLSADDEKLLLEDQFSQTVSEMKPIVADLTSRLADACGA